MSDTDISNINKLIIAESHANNIIRQAEEDRQRS